MFVCLKQGMFYWFEGRYRVFRVPKGLSLEPWGSTIFALGPRAQSLSLLGTQTVMMILA